MPLILHLFRVLELKLLLKLCFRRCSKSIVNGVISSAIAIFITMSALLLSLHLLRSLTIVNFYRQKSVFHSLSWSPQKDVFENALCYWCFLEIFLGHKKSSLIQSLTLLSALLCLNIYILHFRLLFHLCLTIGPALPSYAYIFCFLPIISQPGDSYSLKTCC